MKGTFTENNVVGVALVPQAVSGAVNGATISDPAKIGRLLSILLMGASLNSLSVLTIKVYGSVDGGSNWTVLKEKDNITDLQFTAAKTIDNAELENGLIVGTLDLTRWTSGNGATGYNAYRIQVVTVTGATVTLAAAYVISQNYYNPDPDAAKTDDFLAKQLPLP